MLRQPSSTDNDSISDTHVARADDHEENCAVLAACPWGKGWRGMLVA